MSIKPDYYDNLDKLHDEIVAKLTRGFLDKKSPYRFFVLSTSINNNVNSRMVVLRNFCSKKWELLLHSDCRSKKFQEIESNRNVSLNFWDPKKSIQLRVKGKAEKFNETNYYAWSRLNVWSKRTYLTQKKPGSVSTSPTASLALIPIPDSRRIPSFLADGRIKRQLSLIGFSKLGERASN